MHNVLLFRQRLTESWNGLSRRSEGSQRVYQLNHIYCMNCIAFFYELVVLQEMLRSLQPQLLAMPPLNRR